MWQHVQKKVREKIEGGMRENVAPDRQEAASQAASQTGREAGRQHIAGRWDPCFPWVCMCRAGSGVWLLAQRWQAGAGSEEQQRSAEGSGLHSRVEQPSRCMFLGVFGCRDTH